MGIIDYLAGQGINIIKLLVFIGLIILANLWSKGIIEKQAAKAKKLTKKYGLFTGLLIILWWFITPSGMPDDIITVFLISTFGLLIYIIMVVALTLYLIWRLRITLVIYK